MENYERLNDQLCHIFSYGEFTLCLICKRIISGATSPRSRQDRILNHLDSSDHKESVRTLFKMCISDPACDTDDGKYLDIVTKSIFDISVLLGEENSYICQKNDQLVCLMCRSFISEITSSFAQIKDRITQHLDSAMHANSVKEVCWYYRLNSKNDYLLFYKSILHCSVCEETLKSKETELLQSAVSHVESNSHEVRQHFKELDVGKEKRNTDSEESGNNCFNYSDNLNILEQNCTLNLIKSEVVYEVMNCPVKVKPGEQLEPHMPLHNKGEINTSERTLNEIKHDRVKFLFQKSNKNVMLLPSSMAGEQSSHGNNNFPTGHELVEELLKGTCPFMLKNLQFVSINGNEICCILCCKTICTISYNKTRFETSLLRHFGCREHAINCNTLRGKSEKLTTVREMFVESDREHFRDVFIGQEFVSPLPDQVSTMASSQYSNLKEEKYNDAKITSFSHKKAEDDACSHKRRNKAFDKCITCLRRILKSKCPSVEVTYLKIKNNVCRCSVCKKTLSSSNFDSLMMSHFTHFGSKAHKERLEVYLKRKKKLREKRKKKKEKKKQEKKKQGKNESGKKEARKKPKKIKKTTKVEKKKEFSGKNMGKPYQAT